MASKRKRGDRLYWRERGGVQRAYGNFRDYADVGGGQEALKAEHEKLATSDLDTARALITKRLRELKDKRQGRSDRGHTPTSLAEYARDYLKQKNASGKVTREWVDLGYLYLERAVSFLGRDREMTEIKVADIRGWVRHLSTNKFAARGSAPEAEGRSLSSGTVRHALNFLSNMYRYAASEEKVPPGYNPVAAMLDKPAGVRREARWLEVPQAALLLEAARTLPADPSRKDALPAAFVHALIATYLLTGARSAEVLGLEVDDVSFEREIVVVRPNQWRRVKTLTSARVIPLWPQLAEILRPFAGHGSQLLFPSPVAGQEAMLKEWRGSLDRVAVRAGWQKGEVRSRIFRHSYCSARLMTLDQGAPVSVFTVSREMGHDSDAMVEGIYAHLGVVRHRSEHVEYRVEQHRKKLAEQLERMGL